MLSHTSLVCSMACTIGACTIGAIGVAERVPTPPIFASVFETNFTGIDTTHGYSYAGWWVWDMNQQMDRQDSWHTTSASSTGHRQGRSLLVGDGSSYRQIDIDKWPIRQSFFYCPYQNPPLCQQLILVPPMRPFAVPSESTYKGTEHCGGVIDPQGTCDVWEYVFSASGGKKWITTYWVGTMSAEAEKPEDSAHNFLRGSDSHATVPYPSRIAYTGDQPNVFVNWTSWRPVQRIPTSEFIVPASWDCTPGGIAEMEAQPTAAADHSRSAHSLSGDVAGMSRRPGAPNLPAGLDSSGVELKEATCPPSDGIGI